MALLQRCFGVYLKLTSLSTHIKPGFLGTRRLA